MQDSSRIGSLVEVLDYDTNFFGYNVAQIQERQISADSINHVIDYCRNNEIKLLQFKCDAHHSPSVLLAEQHGFNFVDIRMIFERYIREVERQQTDDFKVSFRVAEKADIAGLKEKSKGVFRASRYYFDKQFSEEKIDVFYQDWVSKAVLGMFDNCLYIMSVDNQDAGYCSLRFGKGNVAGIGIVGLFPAYVGNGYGQLLTKHVLNQCLEKGIKYIDVVTQGRNYPAQRLYQRCGFVIKKLELYYHKWFLEDEISHV